MTNNKNAIDMKTNYFFTKKMSIYSLFGLFALLTTSCGSYQNTSYYDNDGIYGGDEKPKAKETSNANSSYYKEYFSSLNKENDQVFTDVENYSSYNDTIKKNETNDQNANSYTGWGSNTDNVTVNVYNSGWGYNNWYTPSWGYYAGGYYGNYWGYNGWYGNSWMYDGWYSPSWSWGWGWNSWYGPSWYGYYGYGYNPYGYYGNYWGWNNGNLGHNYAYSGGRRNSNFIADGNGGGYISNRRTSVSGGRSSFNGTRNPNSISPRSTSINRDYQTSNPRSYTPASSSSSSPRSYTPSSPRSYTPSTPSSTSTSTPRSYTPPTRSYTPSSYGGSSGGGGSYGGSSGGGGGRSGGGGGRR